jgi:hypothetical protein
MAFTKLTRDAKFSDIICVGVSVSKTPYPNSERVCYENIYEFHTIHLKPKGNTLVQIGDVITWNSSDLFDCLCNYFTTGRNPLIVCNHSLVCIGASDFTGKLERGEIIISSSKKDGAMFPYLGQSELSTEAFIASCPPTILMFKHIYTGRDITMVDIANYGFHYMQDIWNNLSREEQEVIHNEAEIGISHDNSLTCCTLIAMAMKRYFEVVSEHKLGGMSLTYSGQALRAFRRHHYDGSILTHENADARIVENDSYMGGRVNVYYQGTYTGKVYLLDIQSLYPHLGRQKEFPVELQETQLTPSKSTIERWLGSGIVAARCLIDTPVPAYPCKGNGGLSFPLGTFNTTLIAEEFTDAWKEGRVKHVYAANRYSSGRILSSYSETMLKIRTKYKGSNARIKEYISKCITNGLWGKLGQLGNMWVIDHENKADRPYGGFRKFIPRLGREFQYRIIDYQVSKLCYAPWMDNTFMPISAAMNAYSRHYLWRDMQQAGLHNVLYTCVDGMIVTQEGFDRLAWKIAPNPYIYGMYKVSEYGDYCTISGYGRYAIGNKVASQGTPKYQAKQYRGFWSVLQENNTLMTPDVVSGHEVLALHDTIRAREMLQESDNEPGIVISPEVLDESLVLDNLYTPELQREMFHRSEWNE